jgi:hypothetical protein
MGSTSDHVRSDAGEAGRRSRERATVVSQPAPAVGPCDSRAYRKIVVHLTDGVDGVLRVMVLLRQRTYRLRDVAVEVREGVAESRLQCTVLLAGSEVEFLLERLHRMSVVTSAERG